MDTAVSRGRGGPREAEPVTRSVVAALRRAESRLARALAINADDSLPWERRKRAARRAAAEAERCGRIVRPRGCSWCHERHVLERHHWSYQEPLNVTFLCPSCHEIANAIAKEAG